MRLPGSLAYAAALRNELSRRNQEYARDRRLTCSYSRGGVPVICYVPEGASHGNFLDASYRAIIARPEWNRRLQKAHAQGRFALPQTERPWCELDSSCSSDALLMNVFCYPPTLQSNAVRSMLGLSDEASAEFGVRARVPLKSGRFDRTELDMRAGDLFVEAKLTESGFQARPKSLMERYRDFSKVFSRRELPQTKDAFTTYQLVRNVLAAHATGSRFCVICDQRRPDLIEAWHATMRAVKVPGLRTRLQVLTWQELAHALPSRLQDFLRDKYGIG